MKALAPHSEAGAPTHLLPPSPQSQIQSDTTLMHDVRPIRRRAPEERPMPPLTFMGAMLTGLGTILLLHGGSLTARHARDETLGLMTTRSPRTAILPGLGGLAMTAGLALAGLRGSRADSKAITAPPVAPCHETDSA